MSIRVRFSNEQPGIAYVGGPHPPTGTSLVDHLFSKPLPPPHNEENFGMDLFTAASIGDVETIKAHISSGSFAPNNKNKSSWTALHYSAYLGHEPACALLLESGAHADGCNARGQTPLMLASACGNLSTVRLFIKKGASLDRADESDRQALHYAASCSQNTVVDALLLAGGDPNARDISGMTPTLEACVTGHELTFLSLVEKGGDPHQKNNRGEDGRTLAHDSPKLMQLIQQNQKPSKQPQTLVELLEALQLGRLAGKFEQESVDLSLFFELNEKDFDDMGIPYGPKKKMLTIIDRFRQTGTIALEAFEANTMQSSPGYTPRPVATDDVAVKEFLTSIKLIKERNESIKQLALEGLEKLSSSTNTTQLRQILISIIDNSEQIAARSSRHK